MPETEPSGTALCGRQFYSPEARKDINKTVGEGLIELIIQMTQQLVHLFLKSHFTVFGTKNTLFLLKKNKLIHSPFAF